MTTETKAQAEKEINIPYDKCKYVKVQKNDI